VFVNLVLNASGSTTTSLLVRAFTVTGANPTAGSAVQCSLAVWWQG
jgi:hypothetical protein